MLTDETGSKTSVTPSIVDSPEKDPDSTENETLGSYVGEEVRKYEEICVERRTKSATGVKDGFNGDGAVIWLSPSFFACAIYLGCSQQ